eukprot:GEMP01014970.1.p1 GENE.GEMP01014970.1~~GEMP01014970.1.p1  ORF type:complete len:422 (+),score=50.43 GEMP01014970.1:47-1312(+)
MYRPLLLASLILPSTSKFATSIISIGGQKDDNRWKYLSKFGFKIGEGKYSVRLRTIRPALDADKQVTMSIYLDEEWDEVESLDFCEKQKKVRVTNPIVLKPNGEWSDWFAGTVRQSIRPHVWYFAIDDCASHLDQLTRIRFEFKAEQPNGSQFSVEMQGMLPVMVIKALLGTIFIIYYVSLCKKFIASADSLHPVIWTLSIGVGFQFLALLFSLMHMWAYMGNGYGIRAADIVAEILATVSHVLLTSLLILIALGYTLLQSQLGQLDIVIPIVFIICIVNVLLVGFGKIKDDASYKFHENEGIVGWIICVVRVALYCWFLWAINSCSNEARTNVKLLFFFRKFKIASSLYFLSFPLIFLLTALWAPYYRHCVFSIGIFCMQAVSIMWLTTLFLSRGDYFEVSTLNTSFLPGGNRQNVGKVD